MKLLNYSARSNFNARKTCSLNYRFTLVFYFSFITVEFCCLFSLLGPLSPKRCRNLGNIYRTKIKHLIAQLRLLSRSMLKGKFRGHFLPFSFSETSATDYDSARVSSHPAETSGTLKNLTILLLISSRSFILLHFTATCIMVVLPFCT